MSNEEEVNNLDLGVELVHMKNKYKIGDGPDQRCEVTVETSRVCRLEQDHENNDLIDETYESGPDRDAMFDDHVTEVERKLAHARDELGLEEEDTDE